VVLDAGAVHGDRLPPSRVPSPPASGP